MIRSRHPLPEDLHPMSATDWIGRSETAHDHLSHNLLKRIAATFGEAVPEDGADLPPLWQWCFFQDPLPESALGTDGHPARGGFLPAADNRNRMWAGGRIEFLHALRAGEAASRVSTITHVEEKKPAAPARCCLSRCVMTIPRTVAWPFAKNRTSSTASPRHPSRAMARHSPKVNGRSRSTPRPPCCFATAP